jgi:hypothetical protein
MVKLIRSYMSDEATAFELDEGLSEATDDSGDETARDIRLALWFHYDDCKDHKVVANKERWDYFNRLLLLLESNCELAVAKSTLKWRSLQAAAALLSAIFLFVAFRIGFEQRLLVLAIPFGPLSMLITWLKTRQLEKGTSSKEMALAPFPSIGSLLSVRRQVPGFVKRRYPSSVATRATRRIRHPFLDWLIRAPWFVTWCLFSPVTLLVQALPERHVCRCRILSPAKTMNTTASWTKRRSASRGKWNKGEPPG